MRYSSTRHVGLPLLKATFARKREIRKSFIRSLRGTCQTGKIEGEQEPLSSLSFPTSFSDVCHEGSRRPWRRGYLYELFAPYSRVASQANVLRGSSRLNSSFRTASYVRHILFFLVQMALMWNYLAYHFPNTEHHCRQQHFMKQKEELAGNKYDHMRS